MGWTEIHNAVQAAVVRASGLPTGRVIWKYQNANAPVLDYIAMRFSSVKSKGLDYIKTDLDLLRPAGQEYKLSVKGTRETTLEVEAFTATTADSADALGLAELVKSALLLPSVRNLLTAVELSPFDPSDVNYIPDVPSIGFRGRATLSIRCYVPAVLAAEFVGYIATFQGTVTIKGARQGDIVFPYTVPE